MDVDDDDELSEVCRRHFEEAMKFARRSVSDQVRRNSKIELRMCFTYLGICRISFRRTSRSTRCSARPCSSRGDSGATSGSLTRQERERPQVI